MAGAADGAGDWRTAMTHALVIWASGYEPGAPPPFPPDPGEAPPVPDVGPATGADPDVGLLVAG